MANKKTEKNLEMWIGKSVSLSLEDDTIISGEIVKVENNTIWIKTEKKKPEQYQMSAIKNITEE